MPKNDQLSLLGEIAKEKVKEKIESFKSDDFVEMMNRINALPEREFLKLFK